jgi:hypothetical protein
LREGQYAGALDTNVLTWASGHTGARLQNIHAQQQSRGGQEDPGGRKEVCGEQIWRQGGDGDSHQEGPPQQPGQPTQWFTGKWQPVAGGFQSPQAQLERSAQCCRALLTCFSRKPDPAGHLIRVDYQLAPTAATKVMRSTAGLYFLRAENLLCSKEASLHHHDHVDVQ